MKPTMIKVHDEDVRESDHLLIVRLQLPGDALVNERSQAHLQAIKTLKRFLRLPELLDWRARYRSWERH